MQADRPAPKTCRVYAWGEWRRATACTQFRADSNWKTFSRAEGLSTARLGITDRAVNRPEDITPQKLPVPFDFLKEIPRQYVETGFGIPSDLISIYTLLVTLMITSGDVDHNGVKPKQPTIPTSFVLLIALTATPGSRPDPLRGRLSSSPRRAPPETARHLRHSASRCVSRDSVSRERRRWRSERRPGA